MSYITEFRDYDGEFYLPKGWEDNSWHNNICPHAEKRSKDETIIVNIWQDYVALDKRESDNTKRYLFTICVNGDDAIFAYETDNLEEIKEMAKGVNI